jgi:hypothetical protein
MLEIHRKAIFAAVGAVLIIIAVFAFGDDADEWVASILAVATAIAVYLVPNTPPRGEAGRFRETP